MTKTLEEQNAVENSVYYVRDGVTLYKAGAKGARADAFVFEKDACEFRVSLHKHPSLLRSEEKAVLRGTFSFENVTRLELMQLAAKLLIFRWVQGYYRSVSTMRELAEKRTWNVREFLDMERRSPIRKSKADVIAEAVADAPTFVAGLSPDQITALIAALSATQKQQKAA